MSLTAGTLHSTHSEHRWDAGAASCREDTQAAAIPLTEVSQLMMMIAIESLLIQFAHPGVCADLVNRKFANNVNPNLLPEIDNLRWTLFPRWLGSGFEAAAESYQRAAEHLRHLVSRSEELFKVVSGATESLLSYREWFNVLNTIAVDQYWIQVPAKSRCIHILDVNNTGAKLGSAVVMQSKKTRFFK